MRAKIRLVAISGALTAIGFAALSGHGQTQKPKPVVWEYTVTGLSRSYYGDKELNELGAQGWELVGVSGAERPTVFYLKRAK